MCVNLLQFFSKKGQFPIKIWGIASFDSFHPFFFYPTFLLYIYFFVNFSRVIVSICPQSKPPQNCYFPSFYSSFFEAQTFSLFLRSSPYFFLSRHTFLKHDILLHLLYVLSFSSTSMLNFISNIEGSKYWSKIRLLGLKFSSIFCIIQMGIICCV